MNDPVVSNGSETASSQVDARQRLWHDLRDRLDSVLGFAELILETAKAGVRVPTILIVEDDPSDAVWLEQVLGEAGYVAETAATGAEAVARARECRYDGITLDLLLPDMTGWDIVREIRQAGPNVDTPIVVVSIAPQRVAAAGFVVREVVQKPARPKELLNALHRVGVPANEGRPILIVENNRPRAGAFR